MTDTFTVYVRGERLEFAVRAHPWTTIAGERLLAAHAGAIAAASVEGGVSALPPGVAGELIHVLYAGPHDRVEWEYDIPREVIKGMLAVAAAHEAAITETAEAAPDNE